jgi:uncharacterized protein YfaS (alpha-2-macroglobulin family)
MGRTYRVTLRYPDGNAMFVGTVDAEEIIEIPKRDKPALNGAPAPSANNGERMTDPQKRYLFRLLGAQNVEGKKAEEHLKTYFRVSRLADIPKDLASAYIDALVKDQKDAAS